MMLYLHDVQAFLIYFGDIFRHTTGMPLMNWREPLMIFMFEGSYFLSYDCLQKLWNTNRGSNIVPCHRKDLSCQIYKLDHRVNAFHYVVVRGWRKALSSRSQNGRITWKKYNRILKILPLHQPKTFLPYTAMKKLAAL